MLVALLVSPVLAAEPLRPAVDWPVGAVADVVLERIVTRRTETDDAKWTSTETWTVWVGAADDGDRLIVPTDRAVTADEWTGSIGRSAGMMLTQAIEDDQGTWRISADGELVGIAAGSAQRRLAPLAQEAMTREPKGARTWQAAMSDRGLLGKARQRWGALVSLWTDDKPWPVGEIRSHTVPQQTPGLPGGYSITADRSHVGPVPCHEGGAPLCTELAMESRFDPKSVEAYFDRVEAGTAKGPLGVDEEIVAIVTSTDGMRPWRATIRKRSTTLFPNPPNAPSGKKMGRAEQVLDRVLTFDWTLPAGPEAP